jgi:L-lactate permease
MPLKLAFASALNGAVFAFWPVMWIVINGLFLYNIAVASGRFEAFRDWVITHLPNDRRVILVVIGFCFGALLEGVAGGRPNPRSSKSSAPPRGSPRRPHGSAPGRDGCPG